MAQTSTPHSQPSTLKEVLTLLFLFVLSLFSVFGVYNTFTLDLIEIIEHIPDPQERWANYAIMILFVIVMGTLQGINLKKKDLFGKIGVILGIGAAIAAILAIVLFYSNNLFYPILSMLIIGTTMYMLELVFLTIGPKGFFFFLTLFGVGLIALYKQGYHDFSFLVTVAELALALLLFIAATYPRLKALMFSIGTRDNIDIPNTGDGDE
jgi:hypothetical protein